MYLSPNPDFYRDLPRVLANHPEQRLNQSIEEREEIVMNNWYTYYLAETQRRQDDIKAAEMYHLAKLAKNDPSAAPAQKAYQRLFTALGARMVRWGNRLQDFYRTPRHDYVNGRL